MTTGEDGRAETFTGLTGLGDLASDAFEGAAHFDIVPLSGDSLLDLHFGTDAAQKLNIEYVPAAAHQQEAQADVGEPEGE